MQAIKSSGPLAVFKQQFVFIVDKIFEKIDWTKIDQHESLAFVNKNYHQKPSDIAKILIIILALVVLFIEGLQVVTILMCYLLPIGIMILKIAQTQRNERQQKKQQRKKDKIQNQILSKSNIEKNDSTLSIDSKVQSQKEQIKKQQQKEKKSQKSTVTELNKHFIFYFIFNLVLDLSQPIILLLIQTVLNLFDLVVKSIVELVQQGNFWPLLIIPFEFIGKCIVNLITFSETSQFAIVVLVFLRVVLSAFLLNMNKEKRSYCQKFLFEGKLPSLFFQQQKVDRKPKTQ